MRRISRLEAIAPILQPTVHDGSGGGPRAEAGVSLNRFALTIATAVTMCVVSGTALGAEPDKITCAHSYEQAQRLRQAHELKGARRELLVCSRVECPSWVRRDCAPWLDEVEAAIPTINIILRSAVDGSR